MKFNEQIAGILEGTAVGNPESSVFKLKIEEGSEGSLKASKTHKDTGQLLCHGRRSG
jgi:hypothetical protein